MSDVITHFNNNIVFRFHKVLQNIPSSLRGTKYICVKFLMASNSIQPSNKEFGLGQSAEAGGGEVGCWTSIRYNRTSSDHQRVFLNRFSERYPRFGSLICCESHDWLNPLTTYICMCARLFFVLLLFCSFLLFFS